MELNWSSQCDLNKQTPIVILLLKISAAESGGIGFLSSPILLPTLLGSEYKLSFRALASLILHCLDLPKARPFLISISGPQWRMRSPWCEMR